MHLTATLIKLDTTQVDFPSFEHLGKEVAPNLHLTYSERISGVKSKTISSLICFYVSQ